MTHVDDRPVSEPTDHIDTSIDDDTSPAVGGVAVHPASPLAGLAAKRAAARAELFLDLSVPDYLERLGIDLYIRFKPLPLAVTTRLLEQTRKSKSADRVANANAAALAAGCVGIYHVQDGQDVPFTADGRGEWPRFDEDVARLIGASWVNPTSLVRDLYFTDDQVAAAVTRVQQWSEGETRERAKDDRGN